jgi:hypothetical protein
MLCTESGVGFSMAFCSVFHAGARRARAGVRSGLRGAAGRNGCDESRETKSGRRLWSGTRFRMRLSAGFRCRLSCRRSALRCERFSGRHVPACFVGCLAGSNRVSSARFLSAHLARRLLIHPVSCGKQGTVPRSSVFPRTPCTSGASAPKAVYATPLGRRTCTCNPRWEPSRYSPRLPRTSTGTSRDTTEVRTRRPRGWNRCFRGGYMVRASLRGSQ